MNVIDLPELREQTHVFQDRAHAGEIPARMLAAADKEAGIIFAVPAGGVPVGVVMAEKLYCANIRGGLSYALACAYRYWSDVAEEDVVKLLEQLR
ncbi:MAG: hypothetical protein JRE28_13815 [Deltaproteobacteria bacterium]|nr:hypothetical protein [Deltaproteobacteria bacterium]